MSISHRTGDHNSGLQWSPFSVSSLFLRQRFMCPKLASNLCSRLVWLKLPIPCLCLCVQGLQMCGVPPVLWCWASDPGLCVLGEHSARWRHPSPTFSCLCSWILEQGLHWTHGWVVSSVESWVAAGRAVWLSGSPLSNLVLWYRSH